LALGAARLLRRNLEAGSNLPDLYTPHGIQLALALLAIAIFGNSMQLLSNRPQVPAPPGHELHRHPARRGHWRGIDRRRAKIVQRGKGICAVACGRRRPSQEQKNGAGQHGLKDHVQNTLHSDQSL
jgi:hypothetical protein